MSWFSSLLPISRSVAVCSTEQSLALLRFKHLFSLVDPNADDPVTIHPCDNYYHHRTASWKKGIDCCLWQGVLCDEEEGHVIGIDLSCEGLSGPIPSNNTGLLLLPHLQDLNLAFNDFHESPLPEDITRLASLTHLNLSNVYFRGLRFAELAKLSQLLLLDLSSCFDINMGRDAFTRVLRNMTNLQQLALDGLDLSSLTLAPFLDLVHLSSLTLPDCGLQGELPNNIFQKLPRLEELNLNGNFMLKGSFPSNNGNGSSRLKVLNLGRIDISGELPDSIGNFGSLEYLELSVASFYGSLPASIGNLSQLAHLSLVYDAFSGQIPFSLSKLTHLQVLDLSENGFDGQIPFFLSKLTHLQVLDLSRNDFDGQIPDIFVNLTRLQVLDLSENDLVGPIPSHMAGLVELIHLGLSNNAAINGTIPPGMLSRTQQLRELWLNDNFLTGTLEEFGSRSLESVDMSNNKLEGSIPNSIFEQVNLTILLLDSNLFNGSVEFPVSTNLQSLSTLGFSSNNLTSITTAPLFNFTFPVLGDLHLGSCKLTLFPNFTIGSLPSLGYLDLSNNRLTRVPPLPWKRLTDLYLHSNMIEGPIPIPKGYKYLKTFTASENRLTGELPHSICNMSSLQYLLLGKNSLSGTIPECLRNLSMSLSVLNLENNRLSGIIPDAFQPGCSLTTLNLNGNSLEGPVPPSLANYCEKLQVLDLGNNKIMDAFPHWLGSLPKLQVLVLHSNRFHGRLTDFHTNASFLSLQILDLSQNNFIGLLPTILFQDLKAMQNTTEGRKADKLENTGGQYYVLRITFKGLEREVESILTIFETMDFSGNNFQGEIPAMVGNLGALVVLDFSHNKLKGQIPSSMGNLKQLESLDLSSNMLDGKIPDQLRILTFLSFLNLSNNKLDGPIPQGMQFNTFENNSYFGNAGLCGAPLSKKCGPNDQKPTSISEVTEDDSFLDGFGWRAVAIGYGCGIAFGCLVGYVVFLTGRPLWLNGMVEKECQRIVKWRIKRDMERKGRQPAVSFVF